MDSAIFNKIRKIVYEKSGIALRDGKEAMVSARVAKRMRALGIPDHKGYLQYLVQDTSGDETVHLLDVISTNVTSFYRQSDHFDFIGRAVASWLAQKQRRFRFWCAACATGEEPYTLAMTLLETVRESWADMKILATDISTRALQECMEGTYEEEELEAVPPLLKDRYFHRRQEGEVVFYTVRDLLRKPIVFKRLNLSKMPFPMRGPLDAIFCRNVMIYFDNDLCRRLLAEMYRLLKPGGYLLTGHAESLTCMLSDFQVVEPSIYVKR